MLSEIIKNIGNAIAQAFWYIIETPFWKLLIQFWVALAFLAAGDILYHSIKWLVIGRW